MDVVVENLTKSFENQKAVDSISFKAKRGEILGFLEVVTVRVKQPR